jgi:hypothetical protein
MASAAVIEQLAAQFPWYPRELLNTLADAFVETGDVDRALTQVRASPQYESYFPGNRRDDGTLRFSELDYYLYRERARVAIASVGVNPDLFGEQIVAAIRGDRSINELEAAVDAIYERVIDRSPEMRSWYTQNYGIEMSDSALVASVLDPTVGRLILQGQIATAEIGAEAALRGFGIDLDFATNIRQRGISAQQAGQVFSAAAEQLPILDVLTRRHNDPDDDFDLNEFVAASLFDDPEERRRIRRLVAQERSLFTGGSFARGREGELTGLLAR